MNYCGSWLQTLLGQRYGSRPIPKTIPESEMEELLTSNISEDDINVLKQWYWKDTNAVPLHWVLQVILVVCVQTETTDTISKYKLPNANAKGKNCEAW